MCQRRRAALVGILALLTACTPGQAGGEGTLRVFAAASLTEAFTELGEAFEATNDGVAVRFTFGGSSTLAQQVNDGAPADVFASADDVNMGKVVGAGNAKRPRVIARNQLAIIVEPGNPLAVESLADLAHDDVVLVLCAVEVPCGRLAQAALGKADVEAEPSSFEENVKGVVAKVALGEADAGIVFVTDARVAGARVATVEIDIGDDTALMARYAIAVVGQSGDTALADAWVAFVLGEQAQGVLASFGFLPAV